MPAVPPELADVVAKARQVLTSSGLNPCDADVLRLLTCPELPATDGAGVGGPSAAPIDIFTPGYHPPPEREASSPPNRHHLESSLSEQVRAAVRQRHDEPDRARQWTANDLNRDKAANRVTREKRCSAFITHSFGAIVEFPETGAQAGESVAHRFPIDPSSPFRPQHSFQYSLGGDWHGGNKSVDCYLIKPGEKVKCKSTDYNCGCLRTCTFSGASSAPGTAHSYTSPSRQSAARAQAHNASTAKFSIAEVEIFRKTLALFGALQDHGCSLRKVEGFADERVGDAVASATDAPGEERLRDSRSQLRKTCTGRILLKQNDSGHSYLECEHRHAGACDHLLLSNLQDFDVNYLRALLHNDVATVQRHEQRAAQLGIGPLVACNHTRSRRSQSNRCPNLHRGADGMLCTGEMSRESTCNAQFRIFEPLDLHAHPYILVVCTNPHSHPPPERSMTPPLLRDALRMLLLDMRWQLADATPRRIIRDSGFMSNLRGLLDWKDPVEDPVLSDLHPSLGNLDHLAYLIDDVRKPLYPLGTDFQGACHLRMQHLALPHEQRYVRYAEELNFAGDGKTDRMVICMFPSQSRRILESKRHEIDIQFTRVKGWYELQMETWDPATSQSVTLCRAFMTSESADAHLELYRQVFKIVHEDTGQRVRFRYIHGDGIEIITADEHRGHALGLARFLEEVAREILQRDKMEPDKRLCDLTPYEHLARIFRICTVHYKRNVKKLKGKVSDEVYNAMWNLAGTETHTDFDAACALIRAGGVDAANWLKDKECFALAALYQPRSKIPLAIWLAGKSNTNGVEQKHRDVNRDGKGLTLLGGIQRGLQHDIREAKQAALVQSEAIQRRYRPADVGNTQYLSLQRHAREGRRRVAQADSTAQAAHAQIVAAHAQIPKVTNLVQRMLGTGNEPAATRAVKRLRGLESEADRATAELSAALAHGSGRVALAPVSNLAGTRISVPPHLEPETGPPRKRCAKGAATGPPVPAAPYNGHGHAGPFPFPSPAPPSYYTTVPIPAQRHSALPPASAASYIPPPHSGSLPLIAHPSAPANLIPRVMYASDSHMPFNSE
ncbi:hypothetical protein EXIGLDRAFT_767640 [Exidia glandulosa HHB12029]|uniref:Uncharacterized protein n=1 Tax=Exidia glandulosa HHB12029 TaxID=1314781 RepID=A0A165IUA1_EXIGL|nr:hypothetical protein EXIGLDRAFT_767640 [Exidia glandulosa HHB12029]